jgi:DNA-directed RNA polymerase subunit RPC12/RpoP
MTDKQDEQQEQSPNIPLAKRVVLPYQGALPTSAVTVRKFFDLLEAQLSANELASHDIEYFLMNQNTNTLGAYAGFSQIELQVREEDLGEATRVLSEFQVNPLEVEPEDLTDPREPIGDPTGDGMLVMAAAYDNPRAVFDAAASLGAAGVESFLPSLVPRRDRPAGVGKRFVLRVRQNDLDQARAVLSEADADQANDDEPRCPRCGSYRIAQASRPWPGLGKFLFGESTSDTAQLECLRCHHRWPK